jgi:hypothetical protein
VDLGVLGQELQAEMAVLEEAVVEEMELLALEDQEILHLHLLLKEIVAVQVIQLQTVEAAVEVLAPLGLQVLLEHDLMVEMELLLLYRDPL